MQKTIIFGGFAALLCLTAAARAGDESSSGMRDGAGVAAQTTSMTESDNRTRKHQREAHRDRSREHEAGERRREAHGDHDAHEASEHRRHR
jgi:hypothetical protein